jgi:septal ring factor EnvC (AmiA/AmiB activator)
MRRISLVLLCLPLLAPASAPVQPSVPTLDVELRRALAERASAEAEAAKLEQAAGKARGAAEKLRTQQAAAARAIEAAEARITAADTQLRLIAATLVRQRERLAREQQPLSSLLAGLAVMAQRPPLLAIADKGSIDEFVQVRVLLDSTLPVIRQRTASLSGELRQAERLQQAAAQARIETISSREQLAARRNRFTALEREAIQLAQQTSGQALSASDVAIAAAEDLERLQSGSGNSRAAAALASALAQAGPAPARPFRAAESVGVAPFAYRLPAAAPVTEGLGAVNASGVRSRGLTLATGRGTPVIAPAGGVVRFSGPFRDYDGVVIIDHGGGWLTLLLNVASQAKTGTRIRAGQPIGRALGPVGVELSQNGRRVSPAIIAGSSGSLSNNAKGG